MLMSRALHRLLLAGSCLCIYGNPVFLPDSPPTLTIGSTQIPDIESEGPRTEGMTGFMSDVGAGGGVGPNGASEGVVTQTVNGDALNGGYGPREAGGEAQSQTSEEKKAGSISEMGDALEDAAVTSDPSGGREQSDVSLPAKKSNNKDGEDQTKQPAYVSSIQDDNPETAPLSSTEDSNPGATIQKLTSYNPIFVSPQTSTSLSIWGQDGATTSSLPDPLLPEIGENPMPKEDGPESVWTEAVKIGEADTVAPLSQDEATEGTMSSEALPLIFEPFEDAASEGAAAAATSVSSDAQAPAAMATAGMDVDPQLVTAETDSDGPSQAPPLLTPDWTSPWQTSGAELLEPISSFGTSGSQGRAGSELEEHGERGALRTANLKEKMPTISPSLSSIPRAMTAVTMETHQQVHKSRSGLEEMESEEEQEDEDEDDENSEESVEDESEEDLTESPKTSSTPPPYSLIPPPPVWVQRNQGLMRSWVELIREKAGYVSGMLAPVGIGITGALLIVGALYSIRMIHRKRRNSFKHQRRKVRQQEQPREPGTSRQDQAMLLADSSEDEF